MKTRIITTLNNTELSKSDKLYTVHREVVSGTAEDYLAYSNSDRLTEVRVGTNKNNPHKAISCSELIQKLIKRDWLNPKKIFIDDIKGNEDFSIKKLIKNYSSTSPIYTINPKSSSQNQEKHNISLTTPESLTDYDFNRYWDQAFVGIKDGDNIKKQLENMAINGEIYLYNTSKEVYDLLEGSNTVTLIDVNSDIYTNSVDIKPILCNIVLDSNTTAKVDLSIQYSKVDDKSVIYSNDITFNGFSTVTSNNKLSINFNNITQTVNDEVIVEFIDGLIRLFPNKDNILECIISNCTITYGNLKQKLNIFRVL